MVMGKLNQWKICIGHYALLSAERSSCINVSSIATFVCYNQHSDGETEPMENLYWPLCTFKCIKVTMHECPCINILSIAMLTC